MPMVFGCAPVFNTLWVAYWQNAFKDQNPMRMSIYFAGIIMAVVGAVIVFTFAPTEQKKNTHAAKPAPSPETAKAEPPKDNTVWRHPS
jgi:cell division protein FtsN